MSEPQNSGTSSPRQEERHPTPDILVSESDGRFFRSLHEFIEHEKKYLRCPEQGPDELRYIVYRSVFNKVIGRATAYKRLLLLIKGGYDDIIRELQRRGEEAREAQRSAAASTSRTKSAISCRRRAAELSDRISVLQKETAERRGEIERRRSRRGQSTWIAGVTVAESEDPVALDRHLKHLEDQRASLLDRKRRCVSPEAKAKLDAALRAAERRRDQLSAKNDQLKAVYKRLKVASERLSSWEDEEKPVPLEELLGSTLENVGRPGATDAELFEDDESAGELNGYLDRFVELFYSAQYDRAALHAARSPQGVLRNLDTMEMFEGVRGPPGSVLPLLLFFQALLMTVPAGDPLPAALSLHAVRCVLRHGDTQLVAHAVTHDKLTFSEDLGDVLTEHAQKNPGAADRCLALAAVVYDACRLDRKNALSMCRRGLIHNGAEFMKQCEGFTAEDCLWVLSRSPSISLLQLLMEPQQGRAAILSVGGACSTLLSDPQQQQLALQLLDGFVSRGRAVLEEVILADSSSSVDTWTQLASRCSEENRADLSLAILSVLLDQTGTRVLSPDLEGAQLVEHIFL